MKYSHTVTDLGIENEYPKLVRDKIPQIIKKEGNRDVDTRELDLQEFELYLRQKLVEEATELASAENDLNLAEEVADLSEILDELERLNGFGVNLSQVHDCSTEDTDPQLTQVIIEKAKETVTAKTREELLAAITDLRLLIAKIIQLKQFSQTDVVDIQNKKRETRGGFSKRILMLSNI